MKRKPVITIVVVSILILYGCSKVIYTNNQVMDGYKTKSSIAAKFGAPDEIRMADSVEEWLYKYQVSAPSIDRPFKSYPDASTASVVNFNVYKRFILFSMDMNGNVISWQTEGVDFKVTKPQPVATIAVVVIGIALIVGLVVIVVDSVNFPFTLTL